MVGTQVGCGVRLVPAYVVQQMVLVQLKRVPAGVNRMISPAYPNRAVLLQNIFTSTNPGLVELEVVLDAPALVPIPLVH